MSKTVFYGSAIVLVVAVAAGVAWYIHRSAMHRDFEAEVRFSAADISVTIQSTGGEGSARLATVMFPVNTTHEISGFITLRSTEPVDEDPVFSLTPGAFDSSMGADSWSFKLDSHTLVVASRHIKIDGTVYDISPDAPLNIDLRKPASAR